MSVFNFETDVVVHNRRVDLKSVTNALGEGLRIAGFEQNDVASDLAGEGFGRAEGYQVAFIQNGEAVATFGLFHQVGRDDDRDAFLIAQNLEVLPKIAPRAGIEAGGGFVEEQNLGMMEQSFGELDAALHASGKSLYAIGGAVEQSDAGEDFGDAHFKVGAAQAVEVSLMPEVFVGGQLGVDALGLEDDTDVAPQRARLANGVEAGDGGAAGSRDHERGKNAKESGFTAAVRAEKAEEFRRADVEGDAAEGGAILVAMHEVANGDYWLACKLGWLSGGSEIDGG